MSMDYTVVKCTERLAEAVESVDGEEGVTREIKEWKESSDGSSIPFSLVRSVHSHVTKQDEPASKVYLHELLEGSELVFPSPATQVQRSAELEAHLARLRAKAEQKIYNRMVKNIDPASNQMEHFRLGLEVHSVNRQLWAMVNFLVTVIGAFAFGYCAGYYAGYSMPTCVFLGLTLGVLVFLADLYFLVRTPREKSTKKTKTQ